MPRRTRAPRLLLIDDNHLLLRALSRELGVRFEVTATTSARYALRSIADGSSFDLVLCDCLMEDMTGDDFLRCLAAIDPWQAGRTVRMSARPFAWTGQGALCLEKPFRVADVERLLPLLLAREAPTGAPAELGSAKG